MVRRTGSPTAFWDGVTTFNQSTAPGGGVSVSAAGTSAKRSIPREVEQVCFYITVSAATTVSVEVAHQGAVTVEGNEPDASVAPLDANFFPLSYIGTLCQVVFAGPGKQALLVPDFEPGWIRLRTSAGATITAGYSASGE